MSLPPIARRATGRVIAILAAAIGAPAIAAPWEPIRGDWRMDDIASCGIDDVRAGRIMSVGASSMRYGFVLCVIDRGAVSTDGATITIDAQCDLGGGYQTGLTYDWRLLSDDEAILSQDGWERRLVRCEKERE